MSFGVSKGFAGDDQKIQEMALYGHMQVFTQTDVRNNLNLGSSQIFSNNKLE
jgi:hypothetical protein